MIQWFGPRMPGDKVSEYRQYMTTLTEGVFSPREITRVSVMQGHEDDTILRFFPNGFVCHDGDYQTHGDRMAEIKEKGCMYRIQGPFGEVPQAIEQDHVKAVNLNSNEAFFVVSAGGDACFSWVGEGATEDEANYANRMCEICCPDSKEHFTLKEH